MNIIYLRVRQTVMESYLQSNSGCFDATVLPVWLTYSSPFTRADLILLRKYSSGLADFLLRGLGCSLIIKLQNHGHTPGVVIQSVTLRLCLNQQNKA